jgi:MFS family permease
MFLSAVLVDLASWRWLFVLPIVLVVAAIVVTLRSVPNSREESRHGFDVLGSLSSMVAVVGLIFVLHEGPERGWTAPVTLLSLLVGVLGVIGFVAWELRQPAPLLDVRLFRKRGLASGSVALLVVFGVQAGIFVVLFSRRRVPGGSPRARHRGRTTDGSADQGLHPGARRPRRHHLR